VVTVYVGGKRGKRVTRVGGKERERRPRRENGRELSGTEAEPLAAERRRRRRRTGGVSN
jgi:hypothetical protein